MKNYIIRILPNPGPRITHREEKARPQISSPINFDHVLHVGFNPETGEFEGLPPEWERLLSNSGITSTERKENPDTIIAVSSLKTITHFFLLISSSQNSRILIWQINQNFKQKIWFGVWKFSTLNLATEISRWAQVE